jgi:hypothetical protein
MKRDNHLDGAVLDLFVTSGLYREYAQKYLPPHLVDDVDEAAILAIEPRPHTPPSPDVRSARWRGFLPQYQRLAR